MVSFIIGNVISAFLIDVVSEGVLFTVFAIIGAVGTAGMLLLRYDKNFFVGSISQKCITTP